MAEAIGRCRAAGVQMLAWDTASDVDVPAYTCLISEPGSGQLRSAATGYGCHLDPAVALLRAITEAVQSRLTYNAALANQRVVAGEFV